MSPHQVGSLTVGDDKDGDTKIVCRIYQVLKVKVGFELSHMALEMGFHVLSERKRQLFQNWQ